MASPQTAERTAIYITEEGDTWGTHQAAALTSADPGIAANSTGNKLTCATADFFKNLAVGQLIKTAGFTQSGNNGTFTILSKSTDNKEIVVDGTLTTEAVDTDATITPVWHESRFTGESLKYNKEMTESETIRADRMVDEVPEVYVSVSGDHTAELAYFASANGTLGAFGRLLEGAFESKFAKKVVTAAANPNDFVFGSGAGTITSATGTWTGFVVGQWVKIAGATKTGNNGIYKVVTVADTVLTVSNPAVTSWAGFETETATKDCIITGCYMRNGTSRKSFALEKQYKTVGQYELFSGVRVAGFEMNVENRQKVTINFTLNGKSSATGAATAVLQSQAATVNPVITASANVGQIIEGTTPLDVVIRSISLTLDNAPRAEDRAAVGSKFTTEIPFGTLMVNGTISTLFADMTMYNKVINHTDTSLSFRITDPNGKVIIFTVPKMKVSGGPTIPGQNQDVPLDLEFRAFRDTNTDCQIQVDILS